MKRTILSLATITVLCGQACTPNKTSAAEAKAQADSPPSAAKSEEVAAATVTPESAAAPAASMAAPPPLVEGFIGVKAGEWDDNANFRDFRRFLSSSSAGFHRVDLTNRRFLVVRDKGGLGVSRCKISVRDAQQNHVSLTTTASGRAILFPRAEGLAGDKLTVTASCGAQGSVETTTSLGQDEDGVIDLKLQGARASVTSRVVDVAFVLDTTGSMAEEIKAVKQTIEKVATVLSTEQTSVRVGLVEYKDRGDTFVTKVYPFATDLGGFADRVRTISASGGGDTPEDMSAGLHAAMTELKWSEGSVARMAFVIADAPPHLDYQDGPDYATDMRTAAHRGIQLFTVAASGMDSLGQVVFRQMAQYTGGTNMFVLRGGAGPQSVGGGDPISGCGTTHTNYSSGKLDELIVQKIRHELRSIDADPMRIAGLKMDERAKPCEARVVWNDG